MQKMVLVVLADHENTDTGLCFPSVRLLAEECGMSERSVSNQIAKLSAAGLISIERFNHTTNRYILNKPAASIAEPDARRSEPDANRASKPINNQQTNLNSFSSSQAAEKTVISLSAEQQEVFDWAVTHSFWNTATVSLETFLHVHDFQNGKLKAQYDAHKKAQSAIKQTGLNSEIFLKTTGGNYETRGKFNQPSGLSNTENGFADRQRQREEWIARNSVIEGYATRQ